MAVVHPVEDDLWSSVPASHHIARHLTVCLPSQAKVQDLKTGIYDIIRVLWFIKGNTVIMTSEFYGF